MFQTFMFIVQYILNLLNHTQYFQWASLESLIHRVFFLDYPTSKAFLITLPRTFEFYLATYLELREYDLSYLYSMDTYPDLLTSTEMEN